MLPARVSTTPRPAIVTPPRIVPRLDGVFLMLADQVAVVTGASSGIGWALALELTKARCKVGLVARRRDLLGGLIHEYKAAA